METWDAIRARRNVRRYADRPIPPEHLDRILEAGRRSPSAHNRQPWDFVVVTERPRLIELAKVWQGAGHVARSAATVALVTREPVDDLTRDRSHYDLGQATMAMMLAAADLGIGSGHSVVGDQAYAHRVLGLPDNRICAHPLVLGYPADRPLKPVERPDRRDFADVVHREHW